MRTGAARDHVGHYHEAVCYASDDELLAVLLPFLLGGVAAGEPTVVSLGERTAAVLRAALPEASGISFHAGGAVYARPAAAIQHYQGMLAEFVAGGAEQIRIVGEIAEPDFGATWDWWARYESATNHAYQQYPLWSLCAYDVRITPAHVLDDVAATHPRVATADGRHLPGERYVDAERFLRQSRPASRDQLELDPPLITLVDPTPSAARHAINEANLAGLAPADIDDLYIAVSEVVGNAIVHGRRPMTVRYWAGNDRMIVAVTDGGPGPTDPYVGLLPHNYGEPGGLGLWLVHQLCNHVRLTRDEDGFTIRLTVGNPH